MNLNASGCDPAINLTVQDVTRVGHTKPQRLTHENATLQVADQFFTHTISVCSRDPFVYDEIALLT